MVCGVGAAVPSPYPRPSGTRSAQPCPGPEPSSGPSQETGAGPDTQHLLPHHAGSQGDGPEWAWSLPSILLDQHPAIHSGSSSYGEGGQAGSRPQAPLGSKAPPHPPPPAHPSCWPPGWGGPEVSQPPPSFVFSGFFQARNHPEKSVRLGTAAWRLLNASDVVCGSSPEPTRGC